MWSPWQLEHKTAGTENKIRMSHENRKRRAYDDEDVSNPFVGFDAAVLKKLEDLHRLSGLTFGDLPPFLLDELKAMKPASALRVIDRCMGPSMAAMASSIFAAFILQEKVECADRLLVTKMERLVDRCKKSESEADLLRSKLQAEMERYTTLKAERDGLQLMCIAAEAAREAERVIMQADIDRLRADRNRLRDAAPSSTPKTDARLEALPADVRRRIVRAISRPGRHRLAERWFDRRVVGRILKLTPPQVDRFIEFLEGYGEGIGEIVNPSAYMTSKINAIVQTCV